MHKILIIGLLLMGWVHGQAQAQTIGCTREYMPVCGQLHDTTQTFANRCVMKNEGADVVSEGECQPKPVTQDVRLKVAPQLIHCMGVVPMRCMQVKIDDQANWSAHYSQIEGFTFEPGCEYTLWVRITWVDTPPADGSSARYTLLRELSRQPASSDHPPNAGCK
jgi:hypothetical protein